MAATDGDIEAAVISLGLEDWIASLPEGLDTEIGPAGTGLSVGERQLVALIRAALADPGLWSPLVALGAMPWVVHLSLDRWPAGWPYRIRRVGGLVLSSTFVVIFARWIDRSR